MEKRNEMISQSNALTNARYDFSKIEKNVIYRIIQRVRHDYIEGAVQDGLFENMYVTIPEKDLVDAVNEGQRHTKIARSALRSLRAKTMDIEDKEGNWLHTGFINQAKFYAKTRCYEVEVSRDLMPHLVELAKCFTSYSLTVAISLKSKYSQRFYEWACEYKGIEGKTFSFGIEELRKMLKLEDMYAQKQDFKKYVIDRAVNELKAAYDDGSCDLWLEYRDEGRGNESRFYFKVNGTGSRNEQETKELLSKARDIAKEAATIFPKDKKFVQRIVQRLEFDPHIIDGVLSKLSKLKAEYKGADLAKLFRWVLSEDFGIK